ncbi:unnamed protein product [Amoebophrya sp. A120]|nr:unnamed protein product [Amoebophrya sp. A120]|eukprot:GSA120T00012674001.1
MLSNGSDSGAGVPPAFSNSTVPLRLSGGGPGRPPKLTERALAAFAQVGGGTTVARDAKDRSYSPSKRSRTSMNWRGSDAGDRADIASQTNLDLESLAEATDQERMKEDLPMGMPIGHDDDDDELVPTRLPSQQSDGGSHPRWLSLASSSPSPTNASQSRRASGSAFSMMVIKNRLSKAKVQKRWHHQNNLSQHGSKIIIGTQDDKQRSVFVSRW